MLDPADGKSLYHFDKAKEGLTNLMVLPEANTVVFADGGNVYGLDAAPADKPWAFWYGAIEPHRAYEFGSGVAKGGIKLSGRLGGGAGLEHGGLDGCEEPLGFFRPALPGKGLG